MKEINGKEKKEQEKKNTRGVGNVQGKHNQYKTECDYLSKLSKEEKDWLKQFNREFASADLKKDDPNAIHKTKEERKACYDANNAAARDIFSREAYKKGKILNSSDFNTLEEYNNVFDGEGANEDDLIEKLDKKLALERGNRAADDFNHGAFRNSKNNKKNIKE